MSERSPQQPMEAGGANSSDYHFEDWLTIIILWGLLPFLIVQFYGRFIFATQLDWAEEISRYLLIWLGWLGIPIAIRRNSHDVVGYFRDRLPPPARRALGLFVDVTQVLIFAGGAYLVMALTWQARDQYMLFLPDWPFSIVYAGAALGLGIMTIRSARLAWRNWRAGPELREGPRS